MKTIKKQNSAKIPLGKKSAIPKLYNPNILVPIERTNKRSKTKYGIDIWNIYELYWLNKNKIPQTQLCQIRYASSSDYIIESKSLKLYLNSLNQTCFETKETLKKTIIKDIEKKIKTPVKIILKTKESIDKLENRISKIEKNITAIKPFYKLKFTNKIVTETLYTDTFRSLCPVTEQPDFATLFITYSGKKMIKQELFNYLATCQNKPHFHEECIDIIYDTLISYSEIKELTVQGSFLRRGGIDITPIRSNQKNFSEIDRVIRQ